MSMLTLQVLNVQVPFYFKSIVDSMNIDFAAVGSTAATVAGATIFACKLCITAAISRHRVSDRHRWSDAYLCRRVSRAEERRVCQCCSESHSSSGCQCL